VTPQPANDDGPCKSAIVTVRDRQTVQRQREQQQMVKLIRGDEPKRSAIVTMRSASEDMTPEEHQRRGNAADALFQEMKRRCLRDRCCTSF
jgi:hypothetical protein